MGLGRFKSVSTSEEKENSSFLIAPPLVRDTIPHADVVGEDLVLREWKQN